MMSTCEMHETHMIYWGPYLADKDKNLVQHSEMWALSGLKPDLSLESSWSHNQHTLNTRQPKSFPDSKIRKKKPTIYNKIFGSKIPPPPFPTHLTVIFIFWYLYLSLQISKLPGVSLSEIYHCWYQLLLPDEECSGISSSFSFLLLIFSSFDISFNINLGHTGPDEDMQLRFNAWQRRL